MCLFDLKCALSLSSCPGQLLESGVKSKALDTKIRHALEPELPIKHDQKHYMYAFNLKLTQIDPIKHGQTLYSDPIKHDQTLISIIILRSHQTWSNIKKLTQIQNVSFKHAS